MGIGSKWRKTFVLIAIIAVLSYFKAFDIIFEGSLEVQAEKHLNEIDQNLLAQFNSRDVSRPPNTGSEQIARGPDKGY